MLAPQTVSLLYGVVVPTPTLPEKLAAAAVSVPVSVGLVESTIFPVPVTALERVTPPYVRAPVSVRAPVESNVEVAEPPK